MRPEANWQPSQIGVIPEWPWREIEAHIVIEYPDDKYLGVTLGEARELAEAVNGLLAGASSQPAG